MFQHSISEILSCIDLNLVKMFCQVVTFRIVHLDGSQQGTYRTDVVTTYVVSWLGRLSAVSLFGGRVCETTNCLKSFPGWLLKNLISVID